MTLKEAQEVLGQKLNLAQFAEFVPEKTVVVTGEDVDRLLEAARVVEIEKIKQFLEETICSCKCEHLNAKELLDNQEGK